MFCYCGVECVSFLIVGLVRLDVVDYVDELLGGVEHVFFRLVWLIMFDVACCFGVWLMMFDVVHCVGALLVGFESVLFLLLSLIIFDGLFWGGVLLIGELMFDISLA